MKRLFAKPFSFLPISIAFFFVLGCPKETPRLSDNSLLSCSVELGGKSYDVAIHATEPKGTLNLPHGSDLATLKVKTITVSYKAQASLTAGSSISVSNNAFIIAVTAEDGSVKNYTITIVPLMLTALKFEKAKNPRLPYDVMINFANIGARPTQADVVYDGQTSFVLTFSVPSGTKVYVNNIEQTSGTTSQDFLNAVKYKVISKSKDTQTYKIAINYTSKDFTVTSDGVISGNNPSLTTALIGEYMNGVRITEIAMIGFLNYRSLTRLRLPDSLETIGAGAFSVCTGLTGDLTIPNSVSSIGYGAFADCSGFTGSLTLPNSLTSIEDEAFKGCYGFTGDLIIPNLVTSIGTKAFYDCKGFTGDLTIPNSVTSIGTRAFSVCTGFTGTLTIPSSVTSIGKLAFYLCLGFEALCNNSTAIPGADAFGQVTTNTTGCSP